MPTARWLAPLVGTALALTATACTGGGGGKAGSAAAMDTPGRQGGTLTVLETGDFEHLDPARDYVNQAMDFSRLLIRTLTTYKSVNGPKGAEVTPDLATDTGKPSADGRTWTFTLKDGLRYEDGSPITSQDVKYGVERSFSSQLPEGPQYARQFLIGGAAYQGPYVDGGKGLASIETPDARTIIFKLNQPVGDFSYTVALPTFSPVPRAKDTGVRYDNRPFSSGPYKIQSYQRGKQLVLVRNPYWSRKTDPVRGAYPDVIRCVFGLDPAAIDARLVADAGEDKRAIQLDTAVEPDSLAAVLARPSVRARSVSGLTGFERYIAINTAKVRNLRVRQAIEYAVNKETYRTARGGTAAGDYASTIITPTTPGHTAFDLYKAPPTGDVATAKRLLKAAGVTLPLKMTLATTTTAGGLTVGAAVQEALNRVGIQITVLQLPPDAYYTQVGVPASQPELVTVAWAPDWPSARTVIPPLFDGRQITPHGNQNFAQLNNPAINAAIDRISAITDPKRQAAEWGRLDKQIMALAPIVPVLYDAVVQLHGSKVKGAYLHAFFGDFDIVSLSVA